MTETKVLSEKGFLTSICCPAFADYVRKEYPDMAEHISENLSPMTTIVKYIKDAMPNSKMVSIGSSRAKKMEFQRENL